MLVVVDDATFEGRLDQLFERLLRPFRIGEGVRVAGEVNLVALGAFRLARRHLHPHVLTLLAGR